MRSLSLISFPFFIISLIWIIVLLFKHKRPNTFLLVVFLLSSLMLVVSFITFWNMP
ncbi:hypothetical protein FD47_GL001683 [Lentilactobacillus parafarraginis DSM 18390 = JCM 14109]|uniref:Uncharacterized protein n=1 Tax=Lentilactobacillus parafarraginis DSM 18390 = JCM 14109 TaxID=1423786 RepID=A0A0R1YKT0_9LACO|nr:hypothetical protein FD47_GL001683 [Lentilactobacillus parafarraginis DSM 18390 = JCM 14109]